MSLRSLKSRAKKLCEENNIEFIDFARSTHLHKKWSIVFDKKGKRVNISFGDNRYDDFTQHKDKQRRKVSFDPPYPKSRLISGLELSESCQRNSKRKWKTHLERSHDCQLLVCSSIVVKTIIYIVYHFIIHIMLFIFRW